LPLEFIPPFVTETEGKLTGGPKNTPQISVLKWALSLGTIQLTKNSSPEMKILQERKIKYPMIAAISITAEREAKIRISLILFSILTQILLP
jgi:hypothetical protein